MIQCGIFYDHVMSNVVRCPHLWPPSDCPSVDAYAMATATACDNASDVESTSDYDDVHDTSWKPDFDELEDDGAPVTDVSNSSDRVSNFLLIGFH